MVKEITTIEEFKAAIESDKLVIIDFYANWCGPCKKFSPTFAKLSEEFETSDFYKINVDDLEQVAQTCDVSSLPSFCLFKNGKYITKTVGAAETQLRNAIKKNL